MISLNFLLAEQSENAVRAPVRYRPKAEAFIAGLLVAIAAFAAACESEPSLRVHYLPGFVPGTERILPPQSIEVAPASGSMASGRFKVGAIYNADGSAASELYVKDFGPIVTKAMVRCLTDAGMKALPAAQGHAASFRLATQIESITVDKRFGSEQTVHGRYFSMKAEVKLRFTLSPQSNPSSYSTVTTGTEEEPPAPVGGEVFLPLETDPAESLSVAMSRAVGALVLQPEFRRAIVESK